MADYFVIKEGKVDNVIVCESKELAEQIIGYPCIERTDDNKFVRTGYLYNFDTDTFSSPEIIEQ